MLLGSKVIAIFKFQQANSLLLSHSIFKISTVKLYVPSSETSQGRIEIHLPLCFHYGYPGHGLRKSSTTNLPPNSSFFFFSLKSAPLAFLLASLSSLS